MKKDEKISVDQLLEKVPNKYELVIACGKIAREKSLEEINKNKIMDIVFNEVMEDKIIIKEI